MDQLYNTNIFYATKYFQLVIATRQCCFQVANENTHTLP
jgi:hypothetical protein